jgi:hypothetical protein
MPDFLQSLEPYTSYRYVLGLVLGGLTGWFVLTGVLSLRQFAAMLRDFNRLASEARVFDDARLALDPDYDLSKVPKLKARPGRVVKLMALRAVLRLLSPRSLARMAPEVIVVGALVAANTWALWYVF